jgi:glutathione synthase/RimK-type ligase-like ATP-grasp enzyme
MNRIALNPVPAVSLAERLNAECFCMTLDRGLLLRHLQNGTNVDGLWQNLEVSRPHLFAATPAFVAHEDLERMLAVVTAVEHVAKLEAYRDAVLKESPTIARRDFGPRGVFMGYDFHLTSQGPKLIEINTNAGGAFLNAALRDAQRACCKEVADRFISPMAAHFEAAVATMFQSEWRLQGRTGPLCNIAIVDEAPEQQYLYPEFVLAKSMLERQGFAVTICDPATLTYAEGTLRAGGLAIDLVYNRLVDFMLDRPEHHVLREAYLAGAVVVTPGPHTYALLANKRNLVLLSGPDVLRQLGAAASDIVTLAAAVPQTRLVMNDNAEQLWSERKRLFFKPLSGHGGKAVYRGDKITTATWGEITKGGYVAQELMAPGERNVEVGSARESRKMDVRLYTYDGKLLIPAARLYQGQTTNFRTPGGGFAPVFAV